MKNAVLGVVALALISVTPAFAAPAADTHASSSYAGQELLFGTAGTGALNLSASTLDITVTAGYQRMFMPNIQLGIRGFMAISQVAQPWQAMVFGTFNFDDNIADSLFLGVGAGITKGATMNFTWGAELGKRFEIAHGLMYRPNVSVTHQVVTGSTLGIGLNFLNFSYVW